jgi:sulfate/thiosulfate transport system permease protein
MDKPRAQRSEERAERSTGSRSEYIRGSAALRTRLVGRVAVTLIAVGFLLLFVVLPAANVFAQALSKGWGAYVTTLRAPTVEGQEKLPPRERRALAKLQAQAEKNWSAIKMTLGVAAVVVPLNVVFGVAAAWAISKFRFRGRSLLVSLIDLPFSVSPVVAGLVFVLLMGRQGYFGHWAMNWHWPQPLSLHWKGFSSGGWPFGFGEWHTGVIFTPLATVLASVFVTFPFVARSLIPLMESQGTDAEQAAISLGAGGFKTFWRVTLPNIRWGLIYGVILCTARAMGEFGAVSVVSGHLDANDTMPLRVEKLWNEYNTQAAFTVASLLALLAVVTLVLKTVAEWKARRDLRESASP